MGHVKLLMILVVAASAAACASSGAVPRPFPGAPTSRRGSPGGETPPEAVPPTAADTALRQGVVETALRLRGAPYRNGGSTPSGFDCSGLVQYVFAQHGVALPREVHEQYRLGREITLAGLEPGDLIFFATDSKSASHVGVAIGSDQFVHAPSSRGTVRVERFSAPYWARRIVSVRRVP